MAAEAISAGGIMWYRLRGKCLFIGAFRYLGPREIFFFGVQVSRLTVLGPEMTQIRSLL